MYEGLEVKSRLKIRKIRERGITLIALVMTILVLIILSRGNNSIVNR